MRLKLGSKSQVQTSITLSRKAITRIRTTLEQYYGACLTEVQLMAILKKDLYLAVEIAKSNGYLDTSVREELIDIVGYKYAGRGWPSFMEAQEHPRQSRQFEALLEKKGILRG